MNQEEQKTLAAKDHTIQVLAKATRELDARLRMLLKSRFLRLGWRLGFGSKPYWTDPSRDELTGIADVVETINHPPHTDEMARALQHLQAKGFEPKVVLDVGAGKGQWTRNAARNWPRSEFFMIDPLQESESSLRDICREPRFRYLLTAVGKKAGEMIMNITPDPDQSSLLGFPICDPKNQRQVAVTTIDDLLTQNELQPPDLVKIDVQGFELQVMDGGKRMFDSADVFILEVNLFRFMPECPRVDEIIRYMADRNFVFFDVAGLLRRPYQNDLGQMDLVFVSQRSPLISSNRWL